MPSTPQFQPFVHRLVTTLHGPSVTLSRPDGQIDGSGAQGLFVGDRRLLCGLIVRFGGHEPEQLTSELDPDGSLVVRSVARDGSEPTPDPNLIVVRTRRQHPNGFTEDITVRNLGITSRLLHVTIETRADFADSSTVKLGAPTVTVDPSDTVDTTPEPTVRYSNGSAHLAVSAIGPGEVRAERETISWTAEVAAHGQATLHVAVTGSNAASPFSAAGAAGPRPATLRSSDSKLEELFEWGLGDVNRLTLSDPLAPEDRFAAAGSPWYLTLFGRDSLWTARMALPFDLDLAAGTLRVLARRQGEGVDIDAAEQPGRILHEQRGAAVDLGGTVLPPRYFGSIDATPLWIATLVDAWRWGLADTELKELAPALGGALGWLIDHADANGDGLVEYIDVSGHGLANQGWKDSGDSVSWRDGRLANAPIALCEVQGYAFEAATGAADLLDHLGLPGGADARAWAALLRDRFNETFWLEDDDGPFVAIALDGSGAAVDSVSSNPGHLLATGLLDAEQERLVVDRLLREIACPAGLRTLAPSSARFNPISYHNGSIWPHDVGICARAMVLAGFADEAATVLRSLLSAVTVFGGRLPELFGYSDSTGVLPYPASCRPQAWSAATALVAAWACTPVVPGPDGPLLLTPAPVADHVEIEGITVGGTRLRTELCDGRATVAP